MKLWLKICYILIGLALIIYPIFLLGDYIKYNQLFENWFIWFPPIIIGIICLLFGSSFLRINKYSNLSLLIISIFGISSIIFLPFYRIHTRSNSWAMFDQAFYWLLLLAFTTIVSIILFIIAVISSMYNEKKLETNLELNENASTPKRSVNLFYVTVSVIISIFLLVTGVYWGAVFYFSNHIPEKYKINYNNNSPEQVACTMEAKQCADGSYVSRTGPNCEFTECPVAQPEQVLSWKTYTSNDKIITLQYPSQWSLTNMPAAPQQADTTNVIFSGDEGSISITNETGYGSNFCNGEGQNRENISLNNEQISACHTVLNNTENWDIRQKFNNNVFYKIGINVNAPYLSNRETVLKILPTFKLTQ